MMPSTETLLRLLADGKFHSGEQIGEVLGVSRAAIWKAIKGFESIGLPVDAVRGRGYRLRKPMELLDRERILAAIDGEARAKIAAMELLFSIDSTNRYLAADDDAEVGTARVCVAEMQTAGRGRRGREWCSPVGANVYLSIAWRFTEGPARLMGLSLALAVASAQVLQRLGVPEIKVKWPNDVWYQGRKLAGLLLEVTGEANGPCQVVAGIGVNLGMPVDMVIDQPWADLGEAVPDLSRNRLTGVLIEAFVNALQTFAVHGFTPFHAAWASWDAVLGRRVSLILPNGPVEGVAQGIDATGALILETPKGRQCFSGGEVSLRVGNHVATA